MVLVSSPDHTFPEALTTPDSTTGPQSPAALPHRLRDKAVPALRELWSTSEAIGAHRLTPKMRTAQIAASVVATGVLSAVLGGAPTAEQAPEFRAAAPAAGHVQPGPVSPPNTGPGLGGAPIDPVDGWIGQATAVLEAHGVPRDQIDPAALRTIIEHESGGDPMAANDWDSNASAGTPSKGLMQTIDPTFHSFAVPGHQDIWNPVDNIVAATRYSIDRYGSVSNVPGVVGVGSGGGYEGY